MKWSFRLWAAVAVVALARPGVAATPAPGSAAASAFTSRVAPILESYCTDCHGPEKPKGKVNLAGARGAGELAASSDIWFRMLEQIDSGKMPPQDEDQPSPEERKVLTDWVRGEFTQLMLAKQRQEGRSRLRRLTRTEYANTLEDLFGIRPAVELNLPADGLVDGYDKVSTALPLSSEGAMGYLKMAEEELEWVLQPFPNPANPDERRVVHAPAEESGESPGHSLVLRDGAIVSFNTDNTSGRLKYPGVKRPGMHGVRVSVYGYQTDKPLPFGIYVGKTWSYPQEIDLAAVLEAPPGKATVLETALYLPQGMGLRVIPLGLGVPVPKNSQASECRAPGLAVQWLETLAPELPLRADRFLTADFPPALVQEVRANRERKLGQIRSIKKEAFRPVLQTTFQRVGARLFRRDLTEAEIDKYVDELLRQAEGAVSLRDAFLSQVVEMLTSPDFLCVIEPSGRLPDFALGSRLSYFLWNSTSDEKLMDLARQGRLRDPRVLREQTDRLLNDPRSGGFVNDFADQWLGLRAIADTSPDSKLYPGYDELLRYSSVWETRGFLRTLIAENKSVRELVAARWAWLNQPLATHYGLPGVTGIELRKVDLPGFSPYGGIWTQSAVMKVTANGTNTSPVKRGVWVSERLLGIHIPPPPPNINPIEPDVRGAKTLREELALHSRSANCAGCHARFDPYGFALESFDVVGRFRTNYRMPDPATADLPPEHRNGRPTWRAGLPVDCSGKTPEGQAFADITELRKVLASNPRQLALGFVRHLVTYATGTPPTPVDQPAIEAIVDVNAGEGYPLRSLIHGLIQSDLFRSK